MSEVLLNHLLTDEFTDSIGFILPPAPLRRVLQRSVDVRQLGASVRYGQTTEKDIREFVSKLLAEFRPGELFRHDIVLAALAVAMEHWGSAFAEEFLIDLARVQRPEFRVSFRIARECLKARFAYPRMQVRIARYPQSEHSSTIRHDIRLMSCARQSEHGGFAFHRVRYPETHYANS